MLTHGIPKLPESPSLFRELSELQELGVSLLLQ